MTFIPSNASVQEGSMKAVHRQAGESTKVTLRDLVQGCHTLNSQTNVKQNEHRDKMPLPSEQECVRTKQNKRCLTKMVRTNTAQAWLLPQAVTQLCNTTTQTR